MYIRLVAWLALGSSAKSAAAIRAFTCMVISLTVKENRECRADGLAVPPGAVRPPVRTSVDAETSRAPNGALFVVKG
jgi:hypothetical protein